MKGIEAIKFNTLSWGWENLVFRHVLRVGIFQVDGVLGVEGSKKSCSPPPPRISSGTALIDEDQFSMNLSYVHSTRELFEVPWFHML